MDLKPASGREVASPLPPRRACRSPMDIREASDGTLVVSHESTLMAKCLLGLAAVFAATAVYDLTIGPRGSDRLIGLIGSLATCAGAGLIWRERSHFVFDAVRKTIVWSRVWGFRRRSGVLGFAQVEQVLVQSPIGDEGVPSRRICLKTAGGVEVPITVGFHPDHDEAISTAAGRIRALLNPSSSAP